MVQPVEIVADDFASAILAAEVLVAALGGRVPCERCTVPQSCRNLYPVEQMKLTLLRVTRSAVGCSYSRPFLRPKNRASQCQLYAANYLIIPIFGKFPDGESYIQC